MRINIVMLEDESFDRVRARSLARDILENGVVAFNKPHAIDRMRERNVSEIDAKNVIRRCFCDAAEPHPRWGFTYRFTSRKFDVVIAFDRPGRLKIVTVIRIKEGKRR